MITLNSFGASTSSKLSEGNENVVRQGHNVSMRIDECSLAPLFFHIHDRHEKWWFRIDGSMKVEDLQEAIFHYIIQYRIFRLFGIQIVYEGTRRTRRLLEQRREDSLMVLRLRFCLESP